MDIRKEKSIRNSKEGILKSIRDVQIKTEKLAKRFYGEGGINMFPKDDLKRKVYRIYCYAV